MKEKIQRFMWGRYGNDRLNQALMVLAMILLVLSLLGLRLFYGLALVVMVYVYYRMFSKNTYKRSAENQWYLKREMKVRAFLNGKKKELSQGKMYRIFRCPNCRQKLRVPRGRGRIAIRCRKCGTEFIKKS